MQQLSLAPTTVTIDRNWDVNCWGIGDFYDNDHVLRGDKDDFRPVYGFVEEELLSAKQFEVLVIPGLNGWSRYTRKTRDAILRRVREGAGLVLLHPFVGDVKAHPFRGDEPDGDGLIPEAVDPEKTRTYWDYWEYQYGLLARAVLWAARGDGDVRIRSLTATPEAGLSLVLAAPNARTVEVEARARSAYGDELGAVTRTASLAGGEARVEIGAPELAPAGWPGGRSVVDVILRDPSSHATLQWGWAGVDAPQPATLSVIRPNAVAYREGDTMSLVTRAAGDLHGLVLQVRVADDLGRLRAVAQAPARGERTFFHRLDHVLGKRVMVSARLLDGRNRILDELRHEP